MPKNRSRSCFTTLKWRRRLPIPIAIPRTLPVVMSIRMVNVETLAKLAASSSVRISSVGLCMRSLFSSGALPDHKVNLRNNTIGLLGRVIFLKNARGHAYYEFGEPIMTAPERVWSAPLQALTADQRAQFENVSGGIGWPEVGSRMLTRVVGGQDLVDGWVVVQEEVYRYAVIQEGVMLVRTVLYDYLATEVYWSQ